MGPATLLERVSARVRNSEYLTRIGVEVCGVADGEANARLAWLADNANRAGSVHGGALASALLAAAELAAASTERTSNAVDARISSVSITFQRAARACGADVLARVLDRGRDVVHVFAECGNASNTFARALIAVRITGTGEHDASASMARADIPLAGGHELAGSAYMRAAGAEIVECSGEWSGMTMPVGPNDDGSGRVHPGAIAGLIDTCGALSAYARLGAQSRGRGATVSLSIAYGAVSPGSVCGAARLGRNDGNGFIADAEAWNPATRRVFAIGLVFYRIPLERDRRATS